MLFSDVLAANRDLLDQGQPLLMTVSMDQREGDEEPRLIAQEIALLEPLAARAKVDVVLHLQDSDPLEPVRSLLERQGKGGSQVSLRIRLVEQSAEVDLELPEHYNLPPAARQALKAVPGVVVVER